MYRSLITISVLILCCCLVVGANDQTSVKSNQNDKMISIAEQSQSIPIILYDYDNTTPLESKRILPSSGGMLLDIPVNDDCANAQAIGEVDSLTVQTYLSTIDGDYFSIFPNVWYLYTATFTGEVRVAFDDDPSSSINRGIVAVYDGDACPESIEFPDLQSLNGGETIETAVPISSNLPLAYSGSFSGYTRDYTDNSCIMEVGGDGYTPGPDVVYSYTADADDQITFIAHSEDAELALVVMDNSGSELACSQWEYFYIETDDGLTTGLALYDFPVLAGETYYIVLSASYAYSIDANYTLRIYAPDYNTIDRNLTWNRHGEATFTVVSGNQYLIEAGYKNPCSTAVLSIAPAPAPPDNDVCDNATDGGILDPGTLIQFEGDNTGATMGCDMLGGYLGDVWIKFTTEETLDVRLDFCGTASIENSFALFTGISESCPCDPVDWHIGIADPNDGMMYCPNFSPNLWWENLPPGTYYYPMIVNYDFQGLYTINVAGVPKQYCSEIALYGQYPSNTLSFDEWTYYVSDLESGYAVADRFDDVESPIDKVTWWGGTVDQSEENCESAYPYPIRIVFCNYNEGNPLVPSDTVASYDVYVSYDETYNHLGFRFVYQKKFVAELPEPVDMSRGWIIISGDDGDGECTFVWQNSNIGSNNGLVYDLLNGSWSRLYDNLSFCLELDTTVGINDESEALPLALGLSQNYPNPFNAKTSISFSLEKSDDVSLTVFDIGGRLIKTLYHGELSAGSHSILWDGTNQSGEPVSSGIYFYSLETSERTLNNRMVLLK